jgi:hypothetical protein
VRLSYKGSSIKNEAAIFVSEFNRLRILNKLGFKQDGDLLDDLWIDAFILIEVEYNRLQEIDLKKSRKK